MTSNEDILRKRVYQFFEKHSDKPKSFTVNHFKDEGIARSTIYDIIKRAEDGISSERRKGTGKKPKIMTKSGLSRLCKLFDHKCGISQRKSARIMRCSPSLINKTLKVKTLIRKRKKTKIPCRTSDQKAKIRSLCSRLYKNYRDFIWVLDDESYFTLSNTELNGNDNYYSSDVSLTPNEVKYKRKKKFEEKLLVYVVISPYGISSPYLLPSNTAVDQHVYVDKFLSKKLLPYLNELPENTKYIFWPDLARAHYSNKATRFLLENNIKFVTKSENPPNLPECRCIEDFWSCVKGYVYKDGWEAENLDQLRSRIIYAFKNFDHNLVQTLGESTKKRLDMIRRYGLIEQR